MNYKYMLSSSEISYDRDPHKRSCQDLLKKAFKLQFMCIKLSIFLYLQKDSEDESDQRPSFGDGSDQMLPSKSKKNLKRPYSAISAFGDAGKEESEDDWKPSAFVRDKTENVEMSAKARKMMVSGNYAYDNGT